MLQFTFKDGDSIFYDEKCNYERVFNKLIFTCEDNNYEVEIDDKYFCFLKYNKESKFILQKKGEERSACLHLVEKNIDFDIKVLFLQIIYDDYIKVEYILESDEKSIKTLEIRY